MTFILLWKVKLLMAQGGKFITVTFAEVLLHLEMAFLFKNVGRADYLIQNADRLVIVLVCPFKLQGPVVQN